MSETTCPTCGAKCNADVMAKALLYTTRNVLSVMVMVIMGYCYHRILDIDCTKCKLIEGEGEMNVKLYRKDRPAWEFTPNAKHGRLCHITRSGNVYGILMFDCRTDNNVWIGRLLTIGWVPRQRELKAKFIRFADGGKYEFPE